MEKGLLSLKWNNHRSSFVHLLYSLHKKDLFCDVTLACDGQFYPSHKLVLSTCSEYFQGIFQQTQCKHPVIVLKDICSDDLEALLSYMYMGEVNVSQEKLSTLIKAAECLRIKGLAVPDIPFKDNNKDKRNSKRGIDGASGNKKRKLDSNYREKEFHIIPSKELSTASSDSALSFENSKANNESISVIQEPNEEVDSKEGILERVHSIFTNPVAQEIDSATSNLEASNVLDKVEKNSIKQEPPDDHFVDVTNLQENNHESFHSAFTTSSGMQDLSSEENMGTADSQVWDDVDWPSDHELLNNTFNGNLGGNFATRRTFSLVCHLCNYVVKRPSDMNKHLRTHTGEKPFTCHLCSFSSAQNSNLRKHMRIVHGQSPSSLISTQDLHS